jgi:tetratricopeptide (TPR) repeat protein
MTGHSMTRGKSCDLSPAVVRVGPWGWGLLLCALVLVAYLPAARGGFVWDDVDHLTENPCIVGPLGLKEIWTTSQASLCPLVFTTFWVEHRLWGLDPVPYHVINILMHATAALVLWRVLSRLQIPGAWLGAALWALHPVQVESVAWITEMKNTQSALFFLLSVLFFCKSTQAQPIAGGRNRSGLHYALSLLFGALAMASKSSTVVLPLVLGLCAWWMGEGRHWRRTLLRLTPLLLMSALAGAVTIWTQSIEGRGDQLDWTLGIFERGIVAGRALWFYLGKLIWPNPLAVIYPRWDVRGAGALACLPAIAAVALSVLLWANRSRWQRRSRGLLLAWSYFVVTLLPVLGLLDHNLLRLSFVFDHFQYLASMGPLALAAAGLATAWDRVKERGHGWTPALCTLLLIGMGVRSRAQCAVYQDNETLWTATLAINPSCWLAHNNLGVVLGEKGRHDEALPHLEKAVEIRPAYAMAHNNLGIQLQIKNRIDEAMAQFQKAIDIKSNFGEAHYNLGRILQKKGRADDAIAHYQKALENKSHPAECHNYLGLAFQRKGDLDRALMHYRSALELLPDYGEAHNNLGTVLGQRGQIDEARQHFQRAVEIKTDFAEARENLRRLAQNQDQPDAAAVTENGAASAESHMSLGIALGQKGQLDEALAQIQKALELKPDYAEAHYNMGFALQKKALWKEAKAHYERAIELNPDYARALRSLAYLLATSEEASLRDGARAVVLAQQASRLTGGTDPMILDTLAAAEAEKGDYTDAIETERQAIRQSEKQGLTSLEGVLEQHLQRFQNGQPLRVVQ